MKQKKRKSEKSLFERLNAVEKNAKVICVLVLVLKKIILTVKEIIEIFR